MTAVISLTNLHRQLADLQREWRAPPKQSAAAPLSEEAALKEAVSPGCVTANDPAHRPVAVVRRGGPARQRRPIARARRPVHPRARRRASWPVPAAGRDATRPRPQRRSRRYQMRFMGNYAPYTSFYPTAAPAKPYLQMSGQMGRQHASRRSIRHNSLVGESRELESSPCWTCRRNNTIWDNPISIFMRRSAN